MAAGTAYAAAAAEISPQLVSAKSIPTDQEVLASLKPARPELQEVYRLRDQGQLEPALQLLADHLKQYSADRYYFSWKEFDRLFAAYQERYPKKHQEHLKLAREQMTTYPADTEWILPFKNLQGKQVTAYELRHLARQNKSRDMVLAYYYTNKDTHYLCYWLDQVADLNRAFAAGAYDQAGNDIYENYRGGLRIHNWLFCHHAWLAAEEYDWKSQLLLIKTFLHHGAMLQKQTQNYRSGNHHTKGLTALFELAVFFADFQMADSWRAQAIAGIAQHMRREINTDGFQFERSVHYHIGDIENYFRVYQLARLNKIGLPEEFTGQFGKMFTALAQLAQPNRRLPVLQDDTDSRHAENNAISYPMSAGTLLFADPLFRYFAGDEIPAELYWLVRPGQHALMYAMEGVKPDYGSLALEESGYYCMRSGWEKNDLYMTISAGLSRIKPDHQHGEMLGLVAWANGHEILPNYQVGYSDPEYPFWKNSWVKNVALADSLPLGQRWIPNEGGSGFGKWGDLPNPKVLQWKTSPACDYFRGTHDGYDSLGIVCFREVLFIKGEFWIVRDHFRSDKPHGYQQVWQGHYIPQNDRYVVSEFKDGSGLEIIPLEGTPDGITLGKHGEKASVVFQKEDAQDFVFTTLLHPFNADRVPRLNPSSGADTLQIRGWNIIKSPDGNLILSGPSPASPIRITGKDFIEFSRRSGVLREQVDVNFAFAREQYTGMLKAIGDVGENPRSLLHKSDLKLVPSSDWTSGFFPGALWLLFEHSRDPKWRAAAEKCTALQAPEQFNAATHDMGFKIYCSYGQGHRLTQNEKYREILLQSARTLAGRFNPRVGCIRSWDNHRERWQFPVIIDNLMNLELLFWAARASGDSSFYHIAMAHAGTTLKNHFRQDYSTWHVVNYDTTTGAVLARKTQQGAADSSTWSRGEAWALYGCTMIYRESGDERYLRQAEKIADFFLNHPHLPADGVPYWDFDAPGIPDEERDTSAGAILCSALYELSTFVKKGERYCQAADHILESLSSPAYRASPGENGHFLLKHSVGSKPGKTEIDVPLIYADYYFLEANLRYLALSAGSPALEESVFSHAGAAPLLIDLASLKRVKERIKSGDKSLQPALQKLSRDADLALKAPLVTVMDKKFIPPGGDKHDYMSLAPYWWPDPNSRDGLLYIRRDGEVNPEVERYDKVPLRTCDELVNTLALAWYLTDREEYARQAAKLLRAWFLDPATRMNPHLNYAQHIPGRSQGRGVGIIEGRSFFRMADAARLLAGSPAWSPDDQQAFASWLRSFFSWLIESEPGKEEAAMKNNHGSWYDVQAAFWGLYLGEEETAKKILVEFAEKRIARQIEPDGRQPLELERTRALSYSAMNLEALLAAAVLGEKIGLDLWHYESSDGRSIRRALDFLLPYLSREKKWEYQQIAGMEGGTEHLVAVLRLGAAKYQDPRYEKVIADLPGGGLGASRVHLLYPAVK